MITHFITFVLTLGLLAHGTSTGTGDGSYADGGLHHETGPQWGYQGQKGKLPPAMWSKISPFCSGQRQSPVDIITRSIKPGKDSAGPKIEYSMIDFLTFHNRHTVQASVEKGVGQVQFGGATYWLKQFHYHTPSEHTVNGSHRAFEVHLVHSAANGELLVLAVFVEPGTQGTIDLALKTVLKSYAGRSDRYEPAPMRLDPSVFLPNERSFVSYPGSLTTPPCSEIVTWIVFNTPVTLSRSTIEEIKNKSFDVGFKNARPVEKIGTRVLLGY